MRKATFLLLVLLTAEKLLAQGPSGTLRGQVTDETGAILPGASVTASGPSGVSKTATAGSDGTYVISDLAAGDYRVDASAPQLVLPQPAKIALKSGLQTLNLRLKVATALESITVEGTPGITVNTDPSNNATALVISGTDLDALADDPDDLAADLQALAGPSAGPNGGQIFVDGFSGAELPPKSSIREIRTNTNPFSPEYDTLGLGRIEILTKPGTDKFHGTGFFNFGDSFWNSRNSYAEQKAPFDLKEYGITFSGPLSKRSSYSFLVQRETVGNGAIINGSTVDPVTLAVIDPFTQVFEVPQKRITITPRLDYQLNDSNTLTVRYSYLPQDIRDAGVGGFNLVTRSFDAKTTSQTAQITETAILNSRTINETRFQMVHVSNSQIANTPGGTIQVLGAFTGGAASVGNTFETQNNYELTNSWALNRGLHTWKFGARMREVTNNNSSPQNFAGTFTFGGGLAPQLDANNQEVLVAGQPVMVDISSIERYRRTLLFQQQGISAAQIRALGGGATQFTINGGNPAISASQFDIGIFGGDDWRVRPNLTLSYGLRYETQTNVSDRHDFAPRLAIAWAPGAQARGSTQKSVIRAGFGMFYDRFGLGNTETALRYNGIVQQQYVVTNPDFFPKVPAISSLGGTLSTNTIQQISPNLRAPYVIQSALSFERQLPFHTTMALTYANTHGLHLLRSRDINAPLPGTLNPQISGSGIFPLGSPNPVFVMESSGLYNQNQLILNINSNVNKNVSLFGSYVLNRALSNTDGLRTFPANPYSLDGEYGPAATDVRHRVSIGGTIATKWGFRWSPLLTANSGPPFDITVGHDLYGDTLFNGRPGLATDPTRPGLIATSYGLLDPNPVAGEALIPRNFGRGPGWMMLNLKVSKVFTFGTSGERGAAATGLPGGNAAPGGGAPGGVFGGGGGGGGPAVARRYSLSIGMSVRNVLNSNIPGTIIGNITSPLFGRANQPGGGGFGGTGGGISAFAGPTAGVGFSEAANNRRLELQTRFTF